MPKEKLPSFGDDSDGDSKQVWMEVQQQN